MDPNFEILRQHVIVCTRCPRLVAFRQNVPIRPALDQLLPWRKPVPGYGDDKAWLLIFGLAPSAGGGNRTGRVFTGDESGRFLYPVLYETGFANQPHSEKLGDGLQLKGCYVTAAVKCVPPLNKPTGEEFANCSSYFENEIFLLKSLRAVLALGKLAFDAYQGFLKRQGVLEKSSQFSHGATLVMPGWPTLYGSYHPSPQNTYTGKLTNQMLTSLLKHIRSEHAS